MKLAKNQAKAKQHPEVELILFENYSLLVSKSYLPKIAGDILKNIQKTSVSVIMRLLTMKMRRKMRNRSHVYNINGPRPMHGLKYTKYKMYNDGYMY